MHLKVNEVVDISGWEFLAIPIGLGTREKIAVRKTQKAKVYYMVKSYDKDVGELRSEVCASIIGKLFDFSVQKSFLCKIPDYKKHGFSQNLGVLIRLDITRQRDPRNESSQYKEDLIHGADLISRVAPDFLKIPIGEEGMRRKMYTLEVVIKALREYVRKNPQAAKTIWIEFFELTAFDALIGGTDRHYRNWGILLNIEKNKRSYRKLAPAFDNGISLLWRDSVRLRNLNEKSVRAAPSAFRKPLGGQYTLFEVCEILGKIPEVRKNGAAKLVLDKCNSVSENKLKDAILNKMPRDKSFESDEKVLAQIYEYVKMRFRILKEILNKIYAPADIL
ncbi:HipA domain-containing protein [Candidatus Peregrinibacteria bacterium]|nr:HipA domain-containing protein [Candidatus Peregrinibacteria bacterium]